MSGHRPLELCLVTADPALSAEADAVGVERVLVDLETLGKAERQAGQGLFLSTHTVEDVRGLRPVLRDTKLMVRTNPIHEGSAAEVESVLQAGADVLMLAMARSALDAFRFVGLVNGRAAVSILVENADALEALPDIVAVPGVAEIHIGLNDLRLSLGHASLFEPLALGILDRAAAVVHGAGLRFGFGGVTSPRASELPVSAERVIGEQVRLRSQLAWLGRSFRQLVEGTQSGSAMEQEVQAIRMCAAAWARRSPGELEANRNALATEVARGWK